MTQIVEEVKQRQDFYRHISRGAWPFSTRAHGRKKISQNTKTCSFPLHEMTLSSLGWPVADTAALGLQSLLELQAVGVEKHASNIVPVMGIFDCVDVLLSLQNSNGGWGTYELQRFVKHHLNVLLVTAD